MQIIVDGAGQTAHPACMIRLPLVLALACLACPVAAEGQRVDLELALMVDVSRSMSPRELEIQRHGYAAALRSEAVWNAIREGPRRQIAAAYVEWAGTQQVIVDWRVLSSRADLEAFADLLTDDIGPAMRRTSISGALDFATASLLGNAFEGDRLVIDVSGDGPNNEGGPVAEARDRAVAQGITINGLPLMTNGPGGDGWEIDRLDVYYQSCVIGGMGAFMLPVTDWEDFEDAVRRKLVLEIAGIAVPARVVPAQYDAASSDCLAGESMRQQRFDSWGGLPDP